MSTSVMGTVGLGVLAPAVSMTGTDGTDGRRPAEDRRTLRRARRRDRRARRLYALGGLVVLAGFLIGTLVVVDVVH